jgi:hypothetical protein
LRNVIRLSDLPGLSRFALDAAGAITTLVENVHATVAAPFDPITRAGAGRMGGIPGLVYRSIHAGYAVAGAGVQVALDRVSRACEPASASTPERETMLAILNGVWGSHLEASGNPLATGMSLRLEGVPVVVARDAGAPAAPVAAGSGRKLLVLIHGLCMNELGWQQDGHDHGAALAEELGYTPLYLRYNTGLHVSTNGKRLSDLLERLVEGWPEPVAELAVIGYSMGGLVARSAVYYGTRSCYAWPRLLRHLVFLGTPHHGSRLERAGSRADGLFNVTRFSAPFRRLGTTRSAGITDLRHGSVIDEDWEGLDRFGHRHDTRRPVPLPAGVSCYAIGGALGERANDIRSRLLGDGIVPLDSALGIHKNAEHSLAFPDSNKWIGRGIDHLGLLRKTEVYTRMRDWLAA